MDNLRKVTSYSRKFSVNINHKQINFPIKEEKNKKLQLRKMSQPNDYNDDTTSRTKTTKK